MVKITDLEIDEDYEDIVEDVMEECKKYGRVISIVIPRPGIHTSVIGKIFIEYPVVEEAHKAKIGLEGMRFNGNRVQGGFHPEELYFQSNFVGDD
jgi:splicing factor U2AF subunit